jgi:hypothetical protein
MKVIVTVQRDGVVTVDKIEVSYQDSHHRQPRPMECSDVKVKHDEIIMEFES